MIIINALPFDLQNGTTADATQVMADFNEIVNDVNNNAAHNGANNDITSLSALTTPITPAQGGTTIWYGAGGGAANVQTVPTPIPANFTLTAGYSIFWVPSVSNTGAMTLSVNGTTATAVKVLTGGGLEACIGGEVVINQLAKATYDGTQWVLDMDPMVGFGPLTNLASATTTDLGTGLSHTLNITGTTTITAFGSTATIQRPLYKLTFSGAILLTYNATSLILPGSTSITTANGDTCDALYLGSGNWQIINYARRTGAPLNFPANFLQNYIAGLTMSTAGSSATVMIAAGEAADSTNTSIMQLANSLAKTTASWVAGAGGGLDTGAIAINTGYHFFEIQNPTTGAVDAVFSATSTPASGPTTLPGGFTLFRIIGWGKTDASSHWLAFTQFGGDFIIATSVKDVNAATIGSGARTLETLTSLPVGIAVKAKYRAAISTASSGVEVIFTAPAETDQTPTATFYSLVNGSNQLLAGGQFETWTNTAAQIGVAATGTCTVTIAPYGYYHPRGT